MDIYNDGRWSVRPVRLVRDPDGDYWEVTNETDPDAVFGVYERDDEGLDWHRADFNSAENALEWAKYQSEKEANMLHTWNVDEDTGSVTFTLARDMADEVRALLGWYAHGSAWLRDALATDPVVIERGRVEDALSLLRLLRGRTRSAAGRVAVEQMVALLTPIALADVLGRIEDEEVAA